VVQAALKVAQNWKAAAEAAGGTDVKVLFINEWRTDAVGHNARERAEAMYEIALANLPGPRSST
jgi:hypothetical protein